MGREKDWHRYFGRRMGVPHFCIRPVERVAREFRDYEDVPLRIWTNAKVIADPHRQFRNIVRTFKGYPKPVLIRKIKYRWLLSAYWLINCFPLHHSSDHELLPAASGIVNAVNELLRLFSRRRPAVPLRREANPPCAADEAGQAVRADARKSGESRDRQGAAQAQPVEAPGDRLRAARVQRSERRLPPTRRCLRN